MDAAFPDSVSATKNSSCACGRNVNSMSEARNNSTPPRSAHRHTRAPPAASGLFALVTQSNLAHREPFLIEIAGDGPGYPAGPDGLGPPGHSPWSGEAAWSWCRVAAGGLVGWRVSWVRVLPPGFSWSAPGLAVPPPPG